MITNQLDNLLTYILIMKSDNNYKSDLSYVKEKYNRFFNGKPNNIDVVKDCLNRCNENQLFNLNFGHLLNRWKIKPTDEDFDIYYFTISVATCDITTIEYPIAEYKRFFNSFDYIKKGKNEKYAHMNLRIALTRLKNNRLYKILKIKEKINIKKLV